ncbi:MAG TPA: tyrosinase family protein, partial [Vicinamibacteria bacterium]
MRDLAVSDPSDPRGFAHQANIHCWNCGGVGSGIQVHGSWQFFAWHRAYLYFHERILGKLVGDMEFRLPYWDWDVASHRKLPPAYATPGDATNPLWNSTRFMDANDEVPEEDVGED